MDTFKMAKNSTVEISVKISSDASVGSYISIGSDVKKRSTQYNFKLTLGDSKDLKDEIVSEVSNFFTSPDIIKEVMKNTTVSCTFNDGTNSQDYSGIIEKMTNRMFVHYLDVKLI